MVIGEGINMNKIQNNYSSQQHIQTYQLHNNVIISLIIFKNKPDFNTEFVTNNNNNKKS